MWEGIAKRAHQANIPLGKLSRIASHYTPSSLSSPESPLPTDAVSSSSMLSAPDIWLAFEKLIPMVPDRPYIDAFHEACVMDSKLLSTSATVSFVGKVIVSSLPSCPKPPRSSGASVPMMVCSSNHLRKHVMR